MVNIFTAGMAPHMKIYREGERPIAHPPRSDAGTGRGRAPGRRRGVGTVLDGEADPATTNGPAPQERFEL